MIAPHDLDRTLDAWFHGDATTTPPPEPLARAIESTRNVRPRAALLASLGSSWAESDETEGLGAGIAGLRPALVLALALLLVLALAGSALLIGSRLVHPSPPSPFSLYQSGVIAVAKDGDILVADWPGGELRPLVTGPEDDGSPMFSPDGTKLAFTRDGALMVADADGTNVTRLTPDTVQASMWSFAPDGRSLVGVAVIDGESDGPACELMNAPKRALIRPVDQAAPLKVLDIPLWDSWMEISESGGPSFRPTNPQELLVVTQLDPCGPRGIHVYDLTTGAIRTIAAPAGYLHDVKWSPNGEYISYDLTDESSIRAHAVAADGSSDRLLGNAPGTARDQQVSTWSNDGTRIVIGRLREGDADWQPAVVSTSGDGQPVELACGGSTDLQCDSFWMWSPDDSMLIGRGDAAPLQADPDTGEVTELDWHIDLNDAQQWQRVAP